MHVVCADEVATGVESCFFFQAEDGIRDLTVTGVQTCALPISCQLDESLRSGWLSLQAGGPAEFELRDAILERALHVKLRRMTPGAASTATEPLAVAVPADVTALHLARETLGTINLELESRVRLRRDALADANRDL